MASPFLLGGVLAAVAGLLLLTIQAK